MTIRLSTIQAAAKARKTLVKSSSLVAEYIRSKLNGDGGFSDRSGKSDLYYTVFGIEALLALGESSASDAISQYLNTFDMSKLDLVHLGCLARSLAGLGEGLADREKFLSELEQYRSADGGFNHIKDARRGTMYGAFVATVLYQDLSVAPENREGLLNSIASLKIPDGSYGNDSDMTDGIVPSTAAAVTLNHFLEGTIDQSTIDWLLSNIHPGGGFVAIPELPFADLLSTATVLHALDFSGVTLGNADKENTLDFIDRLWSGKGGFCASLVDQAVDCEYTFYGLMALGHLTE